LHDHDNEKEKRALPSLNGEQLLSLWIAENRMPQKATTHLIRIVNAMLVSAAIKQSLSSTYFNEALFYYQVREPGSRHSVGAARCIP